MAIASSVVGTMAASFAVDLLRIPKGYRQALRVIVMMIGLWCAIKLRHVFGQIDGGAIFGEPNVARACGYAPMTASEPLVLGSLAVLGASLFIVLSPVRFFGRKLSLEEVLSVCWVAWSIYMGAFVVYLGLKLPLGLSRAANAPAVGMAVCISVIAVLCLARIPTNWRSAVTKSIRLLPLTLGVVGAIYFFR